MNYVDCVYNVMKQVFEVMFNIKLEKIKEEKIEVENITGDISVKINFIGDVTGFVLINYSKQLALEVLKIMTLMDLEDLNDIACSALAEITNIVSGNTATSITESGKECDISPPEVNIGGFNLSDCITGVTDIIYAHSDVGHVNFTFIPS